MAVYLRTQLYKKSGGLGMSCTAVNNTLLSRHGKTMRTKRGYYIYPKAKGTTTNNLKDNYFGD